MLQEAAECHVTCSHSTDFEVHRNWLAITYSLPLSRWYYDVGTPFPTNRYILTVLIDNLTMECVTFQAVVASTLNCTAALDYPPFFAYFEKLLSIPASFVDPAIVNLHNIAYDSWSAIAYQRTTVILSELLLGIVLLK